MKRVISVKNRYPLQVYLNQDQLQALKDVAQREGVPMASIVRESIARYLAGVPLSEDPALGIIALGSSERRDLARNHDRYLRERSRGQSSLREEGPKA